MLHPVLKEKIEFPELRMLYDSKMRFSHNATKEEVKKYIRKLREKTNGKVKKIKCDEKGSTIYVSIGDELYGKLEKFGNKGGWLQSKIEELEKVVYDAKKTVPNADFGSWRSIEFELIFNNQEAIKNFVKRVRKYNKSVTVKDDHSLRVDDSDNNAVPKEVVVMYKAGDEAIVKDVCNIIKDYAYVNNSCGTHVHFDMRNVDQNTVEQYGTRIARWVPMLKMLLPKSRRTNKYCNIPINSMVGRGGRDDRYAFVNLQSYGKYKTLEIRGHSGTLRADKILNWIKILEKIMITRVRTKTENVVDVNEFIKIYKFDNDVVKYICNRYSKYNNMTTEPALPPPPPPIDIPVVNH